MGFGSLANEFFRVLLIKPSHSIDHFLPAETESWQSKSSRSPLGLLSSYRCAMDLGFPMMFGKTMPMFLLVWQFGQTKYGPWDTSREFNIAKKAGQLTRFSWEDEPITPGKRNERPSTRHGVTKVINSSPHHDFWAAITIWRFPAEYSSLTKIRHDAKDRNATSDTNYRVCVLSIRFDFCQISSKASLALNIHTCGPSWSFFSAMPPNTGQMIN